MRQIVDIHVERLRERLAESKRIDLTVTSAALDHLSEVGFDPAFGARPLKRVIQKEIGDRAAIMILEGVIVDGGSLTVDLNGETIELTASE